MIPSFITVRTKSKRLPQKCLLPFGDCNVIEHIIHRTNHYQLEPIICTSTDPSDDILEEIACKENVKVFRGSLINKLNESGNYFFYIQCGPEQNEISKNIISNINKKNCMDLSNLNIIQVIPKTILL